VRFNDRKASIGLSPVAERDHLRSDWLADLGLTSTKLGPQPQSLTNPSRTAFGGNRRSPSQRAVFSYPVNREIHTIPDVNSSAAGANTYIYVVRHHS
jgi:hypothetical protein